MGLGRVRIAARVRVSAVPAACQSPRRRGRSSSQLGCNPNSDPNPNPNPGPDPNPNPNQARACAACAPPSRHDTADLGERGVLSDLRWLGFKTGLTCGIHPVRASTLETCPVLAPPRPRRAGARIGRRRSDRAAPHIPRRIFAQNGREEPRGTARADGGEAA